MNEHILYQTNLIFIIQHALIDNEEVATFTTDPSAIPSPLVFRIHESHHLVQPRPTLGPLLFNKSYSEINPQIQTTSSSAPKPSVSVSSIQHSVPETLDPPAQTQFHCPTTSVTTIRIPSSARNASASCGDSGPKNGDTVATWLQRHRQLGIQSPCSYPLLKCTDLRRSCRGRCRGRCPITIMTACECSVFGAERSILGGYVIRSGWYVLWRLCSRRGKGPAVWR